MAPSRSLLTVSLAAAGLLISPTNAFSILPSALTNTRRTLRASVKAGPAGRSSSSPVQQAAPSKTLLRSSSNSNSGGGETPPQSSPPPPLEGEGERKGVVSGAAVTTKGAFERAKDVALAAKDRVSLGGVDVSPMGIGAWSWGDTLFWEYSEGMDDELQKVFNNCVGGGVNLFDTAEVYGFGRSEYLCGQFRRDYTGADKGGIVIASKFAPLPWRLGRQSVVDACKASLDRMGAESMEIYQIHWPFGMLSPRYWEGLADCVDQGLVKAVGVSNYGPKEVEQAHAALKARGVQLGSNQIQFSLANRKPEKSGMLKLCEDLDVRVLAYSPLAQGLLTGKYSKDLLPSGPRKKIFKRKLAGVEPLMAELKKIGGPRNKTPAQVSLNWCITKGAIPIPGAKNIRQADENCGALGWRLSEEEMAALDNAAKGF